MAEAENKIQLAVIKKLRAEGIFCWRNNSMGVWDPKINSYRSNPYSMPGVPDIICIIPDKKTKIGQFVGLEIKTLKGKQSADQKLFERRAKNNGAEYHVIKTLAEVDNFLLRF